MHVLHVGSMDTKVIHGPISDCTQSFSMPLSGLIVFYSQVKVWDNFSDQFFDFMYSGIWANRTNISMSNTNMKAQSRREKMGPLFQCLMVTFYYVPD